MINETLSSIVASFFLGYEAARKTECVYYVLKVFQLFYHQDCLVFCQITLLLLFCFELFISRVKRPWS